MSPVATSSLAEVFGFTAEQLAANREGLLLADQARALWSPIVWGAPLVLLTLTIGVLAIRHAHGALRFIAPLLALVAATALTLWTVYPACQDLRAGAAAMIEGPVHARSGVGKGPGRAVLHIGALQLLTAGAPIAVGEVIEQGTLYRAYYLPHSSRLLSIERAGPPAASR